MRTVIVASLVMALSCAALTGVVWWQVRQRCKGTGLWVIDALMSSLMYLILVLRLDTVSWIWVWLATLLPVAGLQLTVAGLSRFFGLHVRVWPLTVLVAVYAAVQTWNSVVEPSLVARNAASSVAVMVIACQFIWTAQLRLDAAQRRAARFVTLLAVAMVVSSVMRIWLVPDFARDFTRMQQAGEFGARLALGYLSLRVLFTFSLAGMVVQQLMRGLQSEQQKFAKAFDSSPSGIVLLRVPDGVVLELNRSFIRISGLRPEAVLGQRATQPPLATLLGEITSRAMRPASRGRVRGLELSFVSATGRARTALCSAELLSIDGQLCLLASIEEISERKRAEAQLREHRNLLEKAVQVRTAELQDAQARLRLQADELMSRNQQLEAVFDSANSGIVVLRDWKVQVANRRALEIFGVAPGEALGMSVFGAYPDEETRRQAMALFEWMHTHRTASADMPHMRTDGTVVYLRLYGARLDPADPTKGSVWVFDDITQERAVLDELQRAKVAAEAATLAKSTFLATMSHEIRTPMNAILGMAHLALKSELTPRQAGYVQKIRGSAQLLLGIINDVLDLSKIEAGKMTVETREFDLHELCELVCGQFMQTVSEKGLSLSMDLREPVPAQVEGDSLRIGQVLLNLVSNAVKFTEHGGVSIEVDAEASGNGLLMLCFRVSDTGIGISAEQQGHLFQSFHQADASTTRKFGGSGLGLAISHKLAELMGGGISVHSVPGVGSRFEFRVPVRPLQPREATASTVGLLLSDAGGGDPLAHIRGARVLVVEDNDINQELVIELLTSEGFEVDLAVNGQVALDMLAHARYDIVLMDMMMPVMDGITATQHIRAQPRFAALPVVAMTGNVMPEDRQRCHEAGMNDFVTKPFEPEDLFAVLRRWVPPRFVGTVA